MLSIIRRVTPRHSQNCRIHSQNYRFYSPCCAASIAANITIAPDAADGHVKLLETYV
jgi:hypothetical protein